MVFNEPATVCEDTQTWSFRGSKSRNKVSVGEPAEGSLPKQKTGGDGLGLNLLTVAYGHRYPSKDGWRQLQPCVSTNTRTPCSDSKIHPKKLPNLNSNVELLL